MRKVLMIIDKFGWSYDAISKGLMKSNVDGALSFNIVSLANNLDYIERHYAQYDIVFAKKWGRLLIRNKVH